MYHVASIIYFLNLKTLHAPHFLLITLYCCSCVASISNPFRSLSLFVLFCLLQIFMIKKELLSYFFCLVFMSSSILHTCLPPTHTPSFLNFNASSLWFRWIYSLVIRHKYFFSAYFFTDGLFLPFFYVCICIYTDIIYIIIIISLVNLAQCFREFQF